MRLLRLRDHKSHLERFLQMWQDFLREQDLQVPAKQALMRALQEQLVDSSRQLFVIERENEIIGFADLHLEEKCFPDEDLPEMCMKIFAFYIKPELRHQTLGTQAFKLIRLWGREKMAALLETEVSKSLDFSNRFLLEQGLELVGTGPRNVWRGFI